MNRYMVEVRYTTTAKSEAEARQKATEDLKIEGEIKVKPVLEKANSSEEVYRSLKSFTNKDKEYALIVCLDTRNQIIKKQVLSIGILNASLVHPREVLREAIKNNANSFIIAHNHPSGDTEPSDADIEMTKRLAAAGRLMGIELADHIVIGKYGYTSLREEGHI